MCGIVGYLPGSGPVGDPVELFTRLFQESRVRGKHAYGIAQAWADGIHAYRSFQPEDITEWFKRTPGFLTIAHTRYCQSGDWRVLDNNQPLILGLSALAMNGVLHMGTKEEYEAHFGVKCRVDNDSEVFLQLLHKNEGKEPAGIIKSFTGSFAAVWLWRKDYGHVWEFWAGRNERRPLWVCPFRGATWFASTLDIFKRAGFPTELAAQVPLGANRYQRELGEVVEIRF